MTFQQLQYVLEVYQAGSVSAAARKLFVGQPSISLTISSLEKELGYPIFHRLKDGVVPTTRGREVINQAARICESYRIITGPEQKGRVRISIGGGSMECCRKVALQLLEENKDRDDVCFRFAHASRLPPIQQVALFELDLWLKFALDQQMQMFESQFREKSLEWIELAEFPVAIHLGPGHRLYHEEHVDFSMLENDYFIDTERKGMAANPIINAVVNVRPDKVLVVEDPQLRNRLLVDGYGYVIKSAIPHEEGRLRQIPIRNLKLKFLAIYNPARPMRPEVARYIELLRQELVSWMQKT